MTKDQVELQARLMAIENMVSMLFASEYISSGWSIEKVQALHQQLIHQAQRETFPNVGAAFSDHFAGEYEENVARLLRAVEEKMAARSR